jgi:hypothetical protein
MGKMKELFMREQQRLDWQQACELARKEAEYCNEVRKLKHNDSTRTSKVRHGGRHDERP